MAKTSKKRTLRTPKVLSKESRRLLLLVMIIIAAGALTLAAIAIIVMPQVNPGAQRGVGADGFRAFQEKDTTLHVDAIVGKDAVVKRLGDKAKSVSDVELSNVFNLDGSRTQTATYPFVRSDGTQASVYVDVLFFKNQETMDDARITTTTMEAGTIQGGKAYYMHAQTIGSDREYRLMVVKGLKVYKFVMAQPIRKVTISEIGSLAVLRQLADGAKFN